MVFEQFLQTERVKKHSLYIFVLGMFYVIFGYYISTFFFSKSISVAMLFTCTLLLVPSMQVILNLEEKIESKKGTRNFIQNHKDIFKIFLVLFIGIFIAYLLLGNAFGIEVFEYQMDFLETRGDLGTAVISNFKENFNPGIQEFFALISQNLLVVIIAFVLSLFYGAGALFLITLNASIFATFILTIAQQVNRGITIIGIFMIHLIPELGGFLLAAIAGGVVSRAIMKEKIGSKGFKNVVKDSMILLLISLGLIIVAAFLEIFVTAPIVQRII